MNDIICWWSGGVTSAVACKLAIDLYGIDRCVFIFLDTGNEDDDTYRFFQDCQNWYGKEIEVARNEKYANIQDVWRKYKSLNVANGAICSSELKREMRLRIEKERKGTFVHSVFGFDIDEPKRARALKLNYPNAGAIFPLLFYALSKKDCIKIIQDQGIEIPSTYALGFHNNNCFKTGCIQGGIGYWQKIRDEYPEKFDAMAAIEHELTDIQGFPVTVLKDQSEKAKKGESPTLVFLKPHPAWPFHKDLSMMKGKYPEPLMECSGFCGTNDLILPEDILPEPQKDNFFQPKLFS